MHPDLNPGNKNTEEQFKQVSAAYDVLGDADKRARYDRGEIDAGGAERPKREYYREYAGSTADKYANADAYSDFADGDDVFSTIFRREARSNFRMRGQDAHYRLELDFLDSVNGAKRQVTLPDGSVLDVSIPAGTRDGQTLRLRGKGMSGLNGGQPGDGILVEISVREHPIFTRKGDDIRIEFTRFWRQDQRDLNFVSMTLPKWSKKRCLLRLRERRAAGRRQRWR